MQGVSLHCLNLLCVLSSSVCMLWAMVCSVHGQPVLTVDVQQFHASS
jgi:hypothetical protein